MNQPVIAATLGSGLIVLCGVALLVGMRRFFVVQKVVFVIACIGTIAMLWCLITHDTHQLRTNLARLMPEVDRPYDTLIADARAAGLATGELSLWQSVRLSVWPFLALIGGAFSISIGGEIRDVRRGQAIGILGAIGAAGLLFALVGWFSYTSIGRDFQAAVTFLDQTKHAHKLPTTPYFTTLVALLSGNVVLTAIICVGFIAWIYFWIPGMLAYAERVMLAMAFDRLAPAALGNVNERFHTPTVAIGLSVVVSVILTWLYACTTFFNTLIFIEAATWAWLVSAVAGILYPWRRPTLWAASPESDRTIFGLPIITFLNALSAVALVGMSCLLWMDGLAAGHDIKCLTTVGGTFALGFVLFYVTRAYRRREGIDVLLAFREIPIE